MKLVAGATGVLGSGFVEVLRQRGEPFTAMQVPWGDAPGVADRVVSYWRAAEASDPGSPITLRVGGGDRDGRRRPRSLWPPRPRR